MRSRACPRLGVWTPEEGDGVMGLCWAWRDTNDRLCFCFGWILLTRVISVHMQVEEGMLELPEVQVVCHKGLSRSTVRFQVSRHSVDAFKLE